METCQEMKADFREVSREEIRDIRYGFEEQSFTYKGMKGLKPGLLGSWQIDNGALAVEAVLALGECGFPVTEEQMRKGLARTVWPGRFTVVDRHPLFVVDGAHNRDAADRLKETLDLYFPHKRKIFIAGVLADKEYDYVMGRLAPLADRVITVMTPDNPRALPAESLAEDVKKYNDGWKPQAVWVTRSAERGPMRGRGSDSGLRVPVLSGGAEPSGADDARAGA